MRTLLLALFAQTVVLSTLHAGEPIPFDSPRWKMLAQESRVEEYMGKTSLFLKGGLALVDDSEFLDGVIEFEVAFPPERGFMGVTFRVQDPDNREEFYIRPHQSGNPDANQYTPVFNGLTAWQLYHGEGYGAPVTYDFNVWIPVKVVVSGTQAEVFIEDMESPALLIDELKRLPTPGKVGLVVANFGPAHFADFRYTALDRPALKPKAARTRHPQDGSIMAWRISNTFDEAVLENSLGRLDPSATERLEWDTLRCETTGLANISRLRALAPEHNTVFARVVLESNQDQSAPLAIGYSDRIRVYLNQHLLYTGNNGYRTRDYRYLGTIGYFDQIHLPLKKGRNELWLAVSESFGGWGVQAALSDSHGVTVTD